MTTDEVNQILETYKSELKGPNGEKIIHNIDGVDRYCTGWAVINDKLYFYLAPTISSMIRGHLWSKSLEWSEFIEKIKT